MIKSMKNYGLYPLNYTIVHCTSSDPNFPIQNINKKSRSSEFIPLNNIDDNNIDSTKVERLKNLYFNCGWSSLRYCTYPQMIITQLSSMSDIKEIDIEINHERIPQKIDVYVYCPVTLKEVVTDLRSIINAEYVYIGSVIPVNHNKNQREVKKLIFHNNENYNPIIIRNCLYIKFLIHKNYENKAKNKFNQVGIVNIEIFGNNSGKILPVLPLVKEERFKIDEILPSIKGLYTDEDYEPYIKEKIQKAKTEYYTNTTIINNEEKRNKVYEDIQILRELGRKVFELKKERAKFEYFKNNEKLMQIDLKLKEIRKYIEDVYPYYGKEIIKFDYGEETDETQYFEIRNMSHIAEENKNDNENENNIAEEDKSGTTKDEENGNTNQNQNQNNDNVYKSSVPSAVSYQILQRHLAKKKMIKENMEMAEENRRNQNLVLNNRNSLI